MKRAVHRRCPVGLPADCEWCYEQRGKVWHLIDPSGHSVDEFMDERSVRDEAEVRLGECMVARAGGGGVGSITWGRGKVTWGNEEAQ